MCVGRRTKRWAIVEGEPRTAFREAQLSLECIDVLPKTEDLLLSIGEVDVHSHWAIFTFLRVGKSILLVSRLLDDRLGSLNQVVQLILLSILIETSRSMSHCNKASSRVIFVGELKGSGLLMHEVV